MLAALAAAECKKPKDQRLFKYCIFGSSYIPRDPAYTPLFFDGCSPEFIDKWHSDDTFLTPVVVTGTPNIEIPDAPVPELEAKHVIDMPTLHIMGRNDAVVPHSESLLFMRACGACTPCIHDGGHFIPASGQQKSVITAFFSDVSTRV